jgi:alpha-galactosidase
MPKKKKAPEGHAGHTRESRLQQGLPGQFERPIKVSLLGAGSFFTLHLVNDLLQIPESKAVELALVDIDRKRLSTMKKLVDRLLVQLGREDCPVTASTKRREVLPGSDYIISCIEVSGLECVRFDNDIPLKYGIDQCIGDTIGPGGLFKGLRTIPVWLEVLKDAEELCPEAIVLNYTNPMGMMCLASGRSSSMQVVGLCHSVQGTSELLARRAGVPSEELDWECAGINHLAWFTRLQHKGKDLYPRLMKKARQDLAGKPSNPEDAGDIVRKDMMLHFGAFITESSGHLSEYLPYYRKRKDLMKKYCRHGYDGGSSFYANDWPKWRAKADEDREKKLKNKNEDLRMNRSWEYASWIIEAREKNSPYRFHGNVMNVRNGAGPLIGNLPHDGCVEVACLVDRNGVQPTVYGQLPPQMAAICASNMQMINLGAQAAIEKSKEAAIHALMLDPLCAAVCSPAEIRQMTEEMFQAEKKFLKGYK